MADGKYYLKKIQEVLEADAVLQALNPPNGIKAKIAKFTPGGNTYPQICLFSDEGSSEMVFPAGHYRLFVNVYVEKTMAEPYGMVKKIVECVNRLINRKASSLSEINVISDIGLRVAKVLKGGGYINYDPEVGIYVAEIEYACVISEGESFSEATAGNRPWI